MDKSNDIDRNAEPGRSVATSNFFTVRPGCVWGPRTIPDHELILVVEGVFLLELDGETVTIDPGEVLCIFPQELHTFRHHAAAGRGVISCIHLDLADAFRDDTADVPPRRKAKADYDPEIAFLFRKCARIFSGSHRYRLRLLGLTAWEIVLRLSELWQRNSGGAPSERGLAMRRFLEQNWNRRIGRRELAAEFHLTPEHVNAVFRRETGMTPVQYLTGVKVHQACRLLMEEGLSVKEAAAACGFEDEFYFSRVFRQYTGRPPSMLTGTNRGRTS